MVQMTTKTSLSVRRMKMAGGRRQSRFQKTSIQDLTKAPARYPQTAGSSYLLPVPGAMVSAAVTFMRPKRSAMTGRRPGTWGETSIVWSGSHSHLYQLMEGHYTLFQTESPA